MSDKVNHVRTFEVLTATPSRRTPRHLSDDEKARLLAEAFSPGGTVAEVARAYELDVSQLYAWRRKALSSGTMAPLTVPLGGRTMSESEPVKFTRFEAGGTYEPIVESLNYSEQALNKKFGNRINLAQARQFGRNTAHSADQRSIANIIYGGEWGRIHLGNTQPNDGWATRRRGLSQLTGAETTPCSARSWASTSSAIRILRPS